MVIAKPHFLIVEPYYGGSHKTFLAGVCDTVDFNWTLITLPARKWKMRMQLAAPWVAKKVIEKVSSGEKYDGILASTFVDVAVLKALLLNAGITLPTALYFHENQFAYPSRRKDPTKLQFTAINFTSALCADTLAFNSVYNKDTFLTGVKKYIKKTSDMSLSYLLAELEEKSRIIHPGFDFIPLDKCRSAAIKHAAPVVVWNHRWEHDKNPDRFFNVLFELAQEKIEFKLIVLGQSFQQKPPIFEKAEAQLSDQIIHFGFVENRNEYLQLLCQGDIVVSTAVHEFFGLSVLEAVRAGCTPLVPDRLAYRELFPTKYRYSPGQFKKSLLELFKGRNGISEEDAKSLTNPYKWEVLGDLYREWFEGII